MLEALFVIVLIALANVPVTQPTTRAGVQFSMQFGDGVRLRGIREFILPEATMPVSTQPWDPKTEVRVERTGRFRFLYTSGAGAEEREVFAVKEWVDNASGAQPCHPWSAHLTKESCLVLIYSHGISDCFQIIDVSKELLHRDLPPHSVTLLTWGVTGPRFRSSAVTGSVKDETLTVAVTYGQGPGDGSRGSHPETEVIRYRLARQPGGGFTWARVGQGRAASQPATRGQ